MSKISRPAKIAIAVAALGYFVDVFDLILFSVVRTQSLRGIQVPTESLLETGILLLNSQMIGMLLGGILWGIYGDKKGRLQVLFGSILLYSVANIANGLVTSVPQYALLRFLAGLGLAGELGAGITLVSELLPKEKRGIGTTIVATVGVSGAIAATFVTQYLDWRMAYYVAGGLGLMLLVLRISVHESGLFKNVTHQKEIKRGSLVLLFNNRDRLWRFINCILPGLPIWFVLGILVTFAPEIGAARGLGTSLTAPAAVFYVYIGFILGDFLSGLLSQMLRSRKKVLFLFISLTSLMCTLQLLWPNLSLQQAYIIYVIMGIGSGYWAVFITNAAEQFGTNLRATVATSVPNFIRGTVVPLTFAIHSLSAYSGIVYASFFVMLFCAIVSLVSTSRLKETFSRDLEFLEA